MSTLNPIKTFLHKQNLPVRYTLFAAFFCLLLVVLFEIADLVFPLPVVDKPFATVVAASDGTPLRGFADSRGIWRYPVRPDAVSPRYIQALLGYEDRWFYQHPGINSFSLARAAWQNLRAGRVVSGGSTLTMQTARLVDPHGRTLAGKAKQMFRALQLERHWSKQAILTYYLNHAPFGGTIEGVQAAAYTYLGKSAAELSHAEAALLAVLPQAPSRLRPDRHPGRARQARDKVLDRLADQGVWPAETVADAKMEVVFSEHFSMPMDCPLLARRLHRDGGGPSVLTTFINYPLQLRLRTLAGQYALRLPEHDSLAILVADNRTMGVAAYVGSADFTNAARFGHVDMVTAVRSPGSTLKPFLYGLALDAGLIHSQSLLNDAPRLHNAYRPGNFSDGFSGPVSATDALQRSLNVPAVQLLEAYGPQTLADRLRNAGMLLRFPGNAKANLTMILGGTGTNLASLVSAYSSLARGGYAAGLRFLDSDPLVERYLLSPGAAWIVRDMLRHPFPGQGLINLVQGRSAYAWKTGTSFGFRDAWALAVSNRFTVGVWVGRPDGTPSPGQYGAATAAPLLLQVLALLGVPADALPRPDSVAEQAICWPTGLSEARCRELGLRCFEQKSAWVLNGQIPPTLPDPNTDLVGAVQTLLVDAGSGLRVDRSCAAGPTKTIRLALWPKSLEPWLPKSWRRETLLPAPDPACGHVPALAGAQIRITGLVPDSRLAPSPDREGLPSVTLGALGGLGQRHWFLDGGPVAVSAAGETVTLALETAGRHQLAVVDEAGNTDQVAFEVLSP